MSGPNPTAGNAAATNPAPSTSAAMATPASPPPATTNPAPGGQTTPPSNGGNAPWYNGFNEDLKGYAQTKGFKDPAALLDSYRNLEKLQGVPQDRLMKLPEKFYDENGNLSQDGRGIYERLGAPKDVAGYEMKLPESGGDQARLDNFLKTAHELGLTKAQAQKLAGADDAYLASMNKRFGEESAQRFKDQEGALKKDWGMAYEDNLQSAREGVRRLGWDSAKIDALSGAVGHHEAMKMFAQLGKSVGEASFVMPGGSNANRPMEPAAAKAKINELMRDSSFAQKLSAGDGDAKAMWDRLHQQAFQGQVNI